MLLLTERERFLVHQLDSKFSTMYKRSPENEESLMYFLGDRFEFAATWSASSGRIPTFRKNPARYLHRPSMKFLTGQEKLACLGWPVTRQIAQHMLTTPLPSTESARSDFLAGNSMHLGNCSIVMLVGLCSFKYRQQCPGIHVSMSQ